MAISSLPIYKLYDIHNISNSRNTIYFLNVYFQVDRLRRPNNARVPWVFEIIALNTSDATRIQSLLFEVSKAIVIIIIIIILIIIMSLFKEDDIFST